MSDHGYKTPNSDLTKFGINNTKEVYWNLSPAELTEHAIRKNLGTLADTGALAINTGEFTGRSPQDRFIVKDATCEQAVWWGKHNIPFEADKFDALFEKVKKHYEGKEIYVRDAFVCADPKYRLNVRVVNELPWGNMFAYNMFIRPTKEDLNNFTPDWVVYNAPSFVAVPDVDGTRKHNFAILNFTKKVIIIGGTGYTGEIKKGIFSALNFILAHDHKVLPMHCSANVGIENNDTALFFGLSGTGKTTLSADPNRKLIGDDEHGWADNSVFNFEGGCYAKTIDLSEEKEPDIFRAIKFGAILENIKFIEGTRTVDYADKSITENTRVSYPLEYINNIQEGSIGENPKNIFFLSADAYGTLPPISRLTIGQAMYLFISGYTAKVAGTEAGVTEPQATFSNCFGAPFMPLHPTKYAELLGEKIKSTGAKVWLINTGWVRGGYGEGERIKLKYTRSMITAALKGELDNVEYITHPVFGLQMPTSCPDVPSELLNPVQVWNNEGDYYTAANALAEKFINNFKQFEAFANDEIMAASPKIVEKTV